MEAFKDLETFNQGSVLLVGEKVDHRGMRTDAGAKFELHLDDQNAKELLLKTAKLKDSSQKVRHVLSLDRPLTVTCA